LQINFTDNFSARIGKQQVSWSEADALSGIEVTNPADILWHGVYGAESAEDVGTNLRMVKLNCILRDFFGGERRGGRFFGENHRRARLRFKTAAAFAFPA
jgi:hypothetical protein